MRKANSKRTIEVSSRSRVSKQCQKPSEKLVVRPRSSQNMSFFLLRHTKSTGFSWDSLKMLLQRLGLVAWLCAAVAAANRTPTPEQVLYQQREVSVFLVGCTCTSPC